MRPRTSAWSSSATACSSSRSPARSSTATRTSSEGRLAKIRSHVVSRASCAVVARELELGDRLGEYAQDIPGDELDRLKLNRNVLAALLEAALAAVYLEHGFEVVEAPIVDAFTPRIEYALTTHVDHKTELQEALARLGKSVAYTVLEVDGPPHDRRSRAPRSSTLSKPGSASAAPRQEQRARRSRRSAYRRPSLVPPAEPGLPGREPRRAKPRVTSPREGELEGNREAGFLIRVEQSVFQAAEQEAASKVLEMIGLPAPSGFRPAEAGLPGREPRRAKSR